MLELYRFNNKIYKFKAGVMQAKIGFHCPRHIYRKLPKGLVFDLEEFIRSNAEQFFRSHKDFDHEDLKGMRTIITFAIVSGKENVASVEVQKKRARVELDVTLFKSYPHLRLEQIEILVKNNKLPLSEVVRHEMVHIIDFYKAGIERQHTLKFLKMAKYDKITAYFHDLITSVRQEGVAKLNQPDTRFSIDWLKVTQFRIHLLKTVKGLHNMDMSAYQSEKALWDSLEKDNFLSISRAHDIGHFMALVIAYGKMPEETMLTTVNTLHDIDSLLRKGKQIEMPSPDVLADTEKELINCGVREFIHKFDIACDKLGITESHRPITLEDFDRYSSLCMEIETQLKRKAEKYSRNKQKLALHGLDKDS